MNPTSRNHRLSLALLFLPVLVAWLSSCMSASGADYVDGQICVTLEPGANIHQVNARWGTQTITALPEANLYLVFIAGIEDLEEFAAAMTGDPDVEVAEVNYRIQTPEAVRQMVVGAIGASWEDFADQEITERIGLDEAHLYGRGTGVTVAVLDTGVDPGHQVFTGGLAPFGFDFVDNDGEPWECANGIDDDGDGLTDEGYGHGSMVAGIVRLVAPEAIILPVRVLNDEGQGEVFAIARAMIFAVLAGADIINLSFGMPAGVTILSKQIELACRFDLCVVAGSGNENREEPAYFPAVDPNVFMITALDSMDVKADFADYHPHVLVSAPGVGVLSVYPGDGWAIGSGCSFAAPFVTGEVALVLGSQPGLERELVSLRLAGAVDPIYEIPGNQTYQGKLGSGRIFLPAALTGWAADVGESAARTPRVLAAPNPSRGSVRLRLATHAGGDSPAAVVLDAAGRIVSNLRFSGDTVVWPGSDARGTPSPTGVYYVRLIGAGRGTDARLVLVR